MPQTAAELAWAAFSLDQKLRNQQEYLSPYKKQAGPVPELPYVTPYNWGLTREDTINFACRRYVEQQKLKDELKGLQEQKIIKEYSRNIGMVGATSAPSGQQGLRAVPNGNTPAQAEEQKLKAAIERYDAEIANRAYLDQRNAEAERATELRVARNNAMLEAISPGSSTDHFSADTPVEPGHNPDGTLINPSPSIEETAITLSPTEIEARDAELAEISAMALAAGYRSSNPPYSTQILADGTAGEDRGLKIMSAGNLFIGTNPSTEGFKFPQKETATGFLSVQDPATIVILDKDNRIQFQTNKFLLTSLSKAYQERFQVIETFGKPTVMFFNDRTKMYTLDGLLFDADFMAQKTPPTLFNGADTTTPKAKQAQQSILDKKNARYQWAQALQEFYTNHLRATKLKEKNFTAAIYVNNSIIKGYPLSLTLGKESSQMPDTVNFRMVWVINDDFSIKGKNVEYLYDGGTSLNNEFKLAFANFQSAVDNYNEKIKEWEITVPIADLTTISDELDVLAVKVKDAQDILIKLMASKNATFYEVGN